MSEMIEIRARALAAKKINSADRYGSRLPADVWKQAIPEAVYAYRIEVMQKLRRDFLGGDETGLPGAGLATPNVGKVDRRIQGI